MGHPVSIKGVVVRDGRVLLLKNDRADVGLFTVDEMAALPVPSGYRRSITTWFERLRHESALVGEDLK